MKMNWTALKNVIAGIEPQPGMFLSLVDEEGNIVCANANMIRSLQLQNPRTTTISIMDLIHPINLEHFRKGWTNCRENSAPFITVLYTRNGLNHPMKWQVSCPTSLSGKSKKKTYLCAGHHLPANSRTETINRLAENNYQLIVEGLGAGILFQDRNGELISANPKTAEIFNTTLERLYEIKDIKNIWDNDWLITSEQGNRLSFMDTPFMRALQTGKPQSEILEVRLRNGESRWIQFSSQPLFEDQNPSAFAVVTDIVDLTQERKLSLRLQERDALFNVFMQHTPNLAWVVDNEANLVFASRSFYTYFGLDGQQASGKKIMEIVKPEVADDLYEKHMAVLETGSPAELVKKVKWPDGTSFVFHIDIFPVENTGGKKMVGGYAVNLADKYAVEKQLRETHDRFLLLSRATTDAIWEWDMQTGRIFRNDALMNMIGYQPVDSKGLSWWLRRIHPEDRNRVADKVKESTEEGRQSWEDEYRFKCADGEYKHMHDKGYIVYENGLPVKMIGSLQDVSQLKELENLLLEEKLERQKDISETVIRVQETERTRIGHELHDNVNQILSTVKLFMDMMVPANKESGEMKNKCSEYLLSAIEEIRKLSKELVVPQLRAQRLVDSIHSIIADIHMSGLIEIKLTHDQDNYLLSPGKKVTIFRIVQEQLKNILKYSKAKQVEISLKQKENDLQLIITDNGVGFDPKQITRGIGLANIHDRVRFYSGKADINSSPGKGCKLTVTIPFID